MFIFSLSCISIQLYVKVKLHVSKDQDVTGKTTLLSLPSQLAFESPSSQIEEFWKHSVQIGLRTTCNDT